MSAILRLLAVLITSLATFGCGGRPPTLPPSHPTRLDSRDNALAATVLLIAGDARCAAEFVRPRVIVTAYHCVRNDDSGEPTTDPLEYITYAEFQGVGNSATPHAATLLAYDGSRDVALLSATSPAPAVVPVLSSPPPPSSLVWAIGHPIDAERADLDYFAIAAGLVTRSHDESGYVQALISVDHGSSGGGLYDKNWGLVGVCSKMGFGGAIGFFSAADALTPLLADYDSKTAVSISPQKATPHPTGS